MTQMKFDDLDKRALHALDPDFAIRADGTTATIAGAMEIEIVRAADDRLRLTIEFPAGEEFAILLSRTQTMKQLDIEAGES